MTKAVKHFDEGGDVDSYAQEDSSAGWTDNGDGTWTWTDDDGNMRQFSEDGNELGAGDNAVVVVGSAEDTGNGRWDGDESDPTKTTRAIAGVVYTLNPDGSWDGDDGSTMGSEADLDALQRGVDMGGDAVGGSHTYTQDDEGNAIDTGGGGPKGNFNGSGQDTTTGGGSTAGGPTGIDKLIDKFKTADGGVDWAKLIKTGLSVGVGIKGIQGIADTLENKNKMPDYQGQIDMGMTFNRAMNPQDPNRRPGSAGTPFFASNSFGPAGGIKSIMGQPPPPGAVGTEDMETMATRTEAFAGGGIARLTYAQGGTAEPRYIRGDTDGMADEVPATIDGKQPAAIAHGEFIWPADVVSHLGNGNSDAGAKKLYQAMDAIRQARTGSKKQGKQIDPDKFLPGMPRMASGGITDVIPRFAEGGTAAVTGVNNWAGPYATNMLSQTNAVGNDMIANPSNYVYQGARTATTNATQQKAIDGAADFNIFNPETKNASSMQRGLISRLSDTPAYQAAGVSSGYTPGAAYAPTQFSTSEFSQDAAQKYMNPYLKLALDPQLEEARRQAEITRMTNAGRLVGSGAFGGGRQAIMEAEGDRNLGTNLANITGQGYNKAYDNSMSQFNADQARRLQADQATEQSRQYGNTSAMTERANAANFGLQAAQINETSRAAGARMGLDALQGAMTGASNYGNFLNSSDANARSNLNTISSIGNDQYTRDQAGLTADMNKFNEEAALPSQALKFKKDMLTGLPVTTTTPVSAPTSLSEQLAGVGLTVDEINKLLGN